MNTYLISYDLVGAIDRQEYDNLIAHIRTSYIWAKPLESVWLIKTNLSTSQVINNLLNFIKKSNDRLLVIQVTNNWMAYNLSIEVIQWMKAGM